MTYQFRFREEPFDFSHEFEDYENGLLESKLELKPEFETRFASPSTNSVLSSEQYLDTSEGLAEGPLQYRLDVWAESKLPATTNGKLYWFDSKNGGSTTAVYIPGTARATDPLCVLVWLHGDLICGDEKGKNAVAYVKSKTFPLAQQLADSKRPFVLVVPSLWKWKGQHSHILGSPQKMNAFLEEVRTGLTGAGWSSPPSIGRLILAGHSRGYAVSNSLAARVNDAQSSQGALATLTDVWLFDTTYGERDKQAVTDMWLGWAKTMANAKRDVNLRILYIKNSPTAAVAELIRRKAFEAKLKNVDVKDIDLKPLQRKLWHCAMPRMLMPELLATSGNCPARSKGPSVPRTTSSPVPSAPLPTPPRPSNGSLFQQIQNALASGQWYLGLGLAVLAGIRDENKLASMVFFAQHPERSGRKIEKSEPDFKQLSREWLDIRDRIVRPFLAKDTPAKPSGPEPTIPVVGSKPYPEVNTLLPPSGPGFIRRKREKQETKSYGLPETIRALQEIATEWYKTHPRGPRIVISDISPQGGSLGRFEPHSSHRVGLDVDLNLEGGKANWYNKGPKINNRWQWRKNPTYSVPLTQELARLILIHPKGGLKVKFILFDDPEVMRISNKVRKDPKSPHRDHFHVRFYAPAYFASRVDERYKSST